MTHTTNTQGEETMINTLDKQITFNSYDNVWLVYINHWTLLGEETILESFKTEEEAKQYADKF